MNFATHDANLKLADRISSHFSTRPGRAYVPIGNIHKPNYTGVKSLCIRRSENEDKAPYCLYFQEIWVLKWFYNKTFKMPRIMIKGGVWRNTEVNRLYKIHIFYLLSHDFSKTFLVLFNVSRIFSLSRWPCFTYFSLAIYMFTNFIYCVILSILFIGWNSQSRCYEIWQEPMGKNCVFTT